MIFEDDILVARDAVGLQHAVEQLPTDNLGYISLYTPLGTMLSVSNCEKAGRLLGISPSTWGALGYCFSRESLEFALAPHPRGRSGTDWTS